MLSNKSEVFPAPQ